MALACAAMMLPASAQWNPGDKSMTKLEGKTNIEYNNPKMILKADGSTILAYRTYGHQTASGDEYSNYFEVACLDYNGYPC